MYMVMVASEDFLAGGNYNIDTTPPYGHPISNDSFRNLTQIAEQFRDRLGSFEKLSARDCFQTYSTQYVSTRGDLLLVQNHVGQEYIVDSAIPHSIPDYVSSILQPESPPSIRTWFDYENNTGFPYLSVPIRYPSYDWVCPLNSQNPCDPRNRTEIPSPDTWQPYGDRVQYCWSEKVEENCRVGFSLYFAIVVMVCNFVKVIGMFLTLKTHKRSALITVGDAIESFLDDEDVTTRGLCSQSTDLIQLLWSWKNVSELALPHEKLLHDVQSMQWEPKRRYWGGSATRKRWVGCFGM